MSEAAISDWGRAYKTVLDGLDPWLHNQTDVDRRDLADKAARLAVGHIDPILRDYQLVHQLLDKMDIPKEPGVDGFFRVAARLERLTPESFTALGADDIAQAMDLLDAWGIPAFEDEVRLALPARLGYLHTELEEARRSADQAAVQIIDLRQAVGSLSLVTLQADHAGCQRQLYDSSVAWKAAYDRKEAEVAALKQSLSRPAAAPARRPAKPSTRPSSRPAAGNTSRPAGKPRTTKARLYSIVGVLILFLVVGSVLLATQTFSGTYPSAPLAKAIADFSFRYHVAPVTYLVKQRANDNLAGAVYKAFQADDSAHMKPGNTYDATPQLTYARNHVADYFHGGSVDRGDISRWHDYIRDLQNESTDYTGGRKYDELDHALAGTITAWLQGFQPPKLT